MVYHLTPGTEYPFNWIDILDPSQSELQDIASKYGLLEQSVQDALQTDHLPKYEHLKTYTFSILRFYAPDNEVEADTVQELTNKLALFIGKDFIITIHKRQWPALDKITREFIHEETWKKPTHVFNAIVVAALQSFDAPGKKLTRSIEYYEENIFLKNKKKPILKGLYFLKRKVDVVRRILLLTHDIIEQVDPPEESNPYTRDTRDLYIKHQNIFDSLSENTNHLLNIYFNISSQKTNETMRVLTIFSVFFLPLTFIVGIYGMNFEHMPEVKWRLGYPFAYLLMAIVTIAIFIWFKRKKWL